MNRTLAGATVALLFSVAFVACGGGGGGSSVPVSTGGGGTTGGGAPQSTATGGPATLSLLIPSTSSASSAHVRRPAYVSTNTKSVAVFAYPSSATPPPTATTLVNVGAGQSGCSAVAAGTSCTITVPAIYGSMTFTVQTFDGVLGQGNLLSSATFTQTITPNQATIPATLSGVIASTTISIPQYSYPAGGGSFTATVNALDANGNVIVGGGTYNNPITVAVSDPGTVTASPSSVTGPGQAVTITYGASAPSGITLRALSAGISTNQLGSTQFSISQSSATTATAYVFDSDQHAVFAYNAGANGAPSVLTRYYLGSAFASTQSATLAAASAYVAVAPSYGNGSAVALLATGSSSLTTFTPPLSEIYGVGFEPSSVATYGGDVVVLGNETSVGPVVGYFPTSSTGSVSPVGTIASSALTNAPNLLATDGSGNLYLAGGSGSGATIVELPAGSTGSSVTPLRTIALGLPVADYPSALAVSGDGTIALAYYDPSAANEMESVQIYNAAGTLQTTLVGGAIGNSFAAMMSFGPDDTLYYATNQAVYAYAPGTTGSGPPSRAFVTTASSTRDVGGLGVGSPVALSTPSAGSISGDMLALTANRTWNYGSLTPATGQQTTITLYVDPQPVDGATGVVAFALSGSAPDALPTDGGILAGAAGFTEDASHAYDAQSYGSVSNDSFGLIPGSPMLVPGTLTLGQTFIPYPGVTATVQGIGSQPNMSACPGSPTSGVDVIYTVVDHSENVSYVPGCGITRFIADSGTIFNLKSIGSHPELGQQSVVQRTLHATYGDTLRSLWQATLVKH